MIATILSLLSSAGFGTIFGGVMGFLNRDKDLQFLKLEIADREKARAHELEKQKLGIEEIRAEIDGKERIALIESESASETAGYSALSKSYQFSEPEKGSKMAAFSAFVRPALSLAYFVLSSAGAGWVLYYAFVVSHVVLTSAELLKLVFFVIEWITFMTSSTVGFWFATRAGKAPTIKLN